MIMAEETYILPTFSFIFGYVYIYIHVYVSIFSFFTSF